MDAPQSIEAVGTTIEDAIARGLEALNAERRGVEIEVLTDAQAREARVRLTVKSRAPQPAVPAAIAAATTIDVSEADTAVRILTTLLNKMRITANVEAREVSDPLEADRFEGPTLVLDIRGDDLGALIGRRGETLDHLQYLARLLVAKDLGHYLNLVIDVEGYKSHRVQTLQQLAQRMAERVASSRKPAALEPMPANERRIVHLALRDHPDVRTESIGSGEARKVTIVPKNLKR